MRSFLRCVPLRFWLVFCVLGLTLMGVAGVRTLTRAPQQAVVTLVPNRDLALEELLPDLLGAVTSGSGGARLQVETLRARTAEQARALRSVGQLRQARAYRELVRWCDAMLEPRHQGELLWRAEVLAQAVHALGTGSTHPIPADAWAGPPTTTTRPLVPPAAERVKGAAVQP